VHREVFGDDAVLVPAATPGAGGAPRDCCGRRHLLWSAERTARPRCAAALARRRGRLVDLWRDVAERSDDLLRTGVVRRALGYSGSLAVSRLVSAAMTIVSTGILIQTLGPSVFGVFAVITGLYDALGDRGRLGRGRQSRFSPRPSRTAIPTGRARWCRRRSR
jgi:hypothetical protein